MDEQIKPEAATPKPWWEGRRFKKVAFFVGIPLLLWIMFRRTDPVAIKPPRPAYQEQNSSAVNPQQVEDAQKQALAQAAQIEGAKEQLAKTQALLASQTGVRTDDLDLSTPQGQAELRNRIALARSANLAGQHPSAGESTHQNASGNYGGGSGESKAERLRKALLATAVVYQKSDSDKAENHKPQPVQESKPPAVANTAKETDHKGASLLDLPPDVVTRLTNEDGYRVLPQGTVVESVLTNKLVGDAAGPVNVMLTTPVYAPGTHEILLPPGTRILGKAASIGGFGDSRLAVAFHRAIITDGPVQYSLSLDTMPGLDQQGAVGLTGKVNQHILSTIAVSGVIGAIGGLANIGNYSGGIGSYGAMQQFQGGVSQYMGQSAMQVLNRFINRRPTVEIKPGSRVKLIWAGDQSLPVYSEAIHALEEKRNVTQF